MELEKEKKEDVLKFFENKISILDQLQLLKLVLIFQMQILLLLKMLINLD